MQFCNDEKFLGTREMTRDDNDQFKQIVLIFNEKALKSFLTHTSTLDFFK